MRAQDSRQHDAWICECILLFIHAASLIKIYVGNKTRKLAGDTS